jgi:ABC-type Na+ transport system ATPase subunit NatA
MIRIADCVYPREAGVQKSSQVSFRINEGRVVCGAGWRGMRYGIWVEVLAGFVRSDNGYV